MNKGKRILAMLLCLFICVFLLPISALAEDDSGEEALSAEEKKIEITNSSDLESIIPDEESIQPEEEDSEETSDTVSEELKNSDELLELNEDAEPTETEGTDQAAIEKSDQAQIIKTGSGEITVSANAGEDQIRSLQLGEETYAAVENEDEWAFLSFVPNTSGEYLFYSRLSYFEYLMGAVYDENWKQLKEVSANGLNGNFTVRCSLTAGETYYFSARYSAINITGSIPVGLIEADFTACAKEETVRVQPRQKATLQVITTGDVTCQWYKPGGWYENIPLDGETSDSLVLDVSGYEDYFCYVTGPSGVGEGIPFSVGVNNELRAKDKETGLNYLWKTVSYGEDVTLEIQISCTDPENMTITWRADGVEMATGIKTVAVTNVTKSTEYKAEVVDQYGTHAYVTYHIRIDNELSVTVNNDDNRHIHLAEGETTAIKLNIRARNMENIHIVWNRMVTVNGLGWYDGIVAEDVDEYVTEPAESSQTYICNITDCYNNSLDIWIWVEIENHFSVQGVGTEQYVKDGDMVTFRVDVSADNTDDLVYYWEEVRHYEDGSVSFFCVEDGNTDTIVVGPMNGERMHYNCIVTDKYGSSIETGFWAYPISEFYGKLNKEDLTLPAKKTAQLKVVFKSNPDIEVEAKWKSNAPSVATVNKNGLVTAKKVGTVKITATVEGVELTCNVRVLFSDVTDSKRSFYAPVYWAYENGITTGTSAATFSPNDSCTRAQIVTFLWRLRGCPEPRSAESPFADVTNASASYYKAVLWALENGVTTGTSATTFSPTKPCTRAQCVTFLWRALGCPEPSTTKSPFKDVTNPGASYYKAVLWALENGITTGTSKTTFSPNNTCTRGQIVTFLYRYDDLSQ